MKFRRIIILLVAVLTLLACTSCKSHNVEYQRARWLEAIGDIDLRSSYAVAGSGETGMYGRLIFASYFSDCNNVAYYLFGLEGSDSNCAVVNFRSKLDDTVSYEVFIISDGSDLYIRIEFGKNDAGQEAMNYTDLKYKVESANGKAFVNNVLTEVSAIRQHMTETLETTKFTSVDDGYKYRDTDQMVEGKIVKSRTLSTEFIGDERKITCGYKEKKQSISEPFSVSLEAFRYIDSESPAYTLFLSSSDRQDEMYFSEVYEELKQGAQTELPEELPKLETELIEKIMKVLPKK